MAMTNGEIVRAGINGFSSLFYVIFLTTLIKYRKCPPFNSSFFKICLSIGATDLLTMTHTYLFILIPEYGYFHQFYIIYGHGPLPAYGMFSFFYLVFGQHVGVFLLALNRYTATVRPFLHHRLWSTRLWLALLMHYVVPLLVMGPMWLSSYSYQYMICWKNRVNYCPNGVADRFNHSRFWQNPEDRRVYADRVNIYFDDPFVKALYCVGVGALLNLVINITIVMMLSSVVRSLWINHCNFKRLMAQEVAAINHHHHVTSPAGVLERTETRLALATTLLFLSMICYFFFLIGYGLGLDDRYPLLLTVYQVATDGLSTLNPYILFVMSSAVRSGIWALIRCNHEVTTFV